MIILPSATTRFIIFLVLIITMAICVRTKKLTIPAAILAGIIGFVVATGTGLIGFLSLVLFFALGVWATSHRKELKAKLSTDGVHPEGRKTSQVFANGGVAAIASSLAYIDRLHTDLYLMIVAASLASAMADTLSSELGMVYGRSFYNIMTFKKATKGLDGVVSLEGTLIGAAGAALVALLYTGFERNGLIVFIAGILGNFVDSILGATLERKKQIGNDVVNFFNTLAAAAFAGICYFIFYGC